MSGYPEESRKRTTEKLNAQVDTCLKCLDSASPGVHEKCSMIQHPSRQVRNNQNNKTG